MARAKERMSNIMKGRDITWGDKLSKALRKFPPEQVEQIRKRIEAGELVKDIAADFGVNRTTISKIKKGDYCDRRYR